MTSPGFEDVHGAYVADPKSLIGTFRRLGDEGPAYEIMEIDTEGNVIIEVVYSSERVTQKLANVLADPIAETIP
jgi:hypothetical protein